MKLALGIDTGGTYTDAALVNHATGDVLAGAKSLTTRHDLAQGIGEAIQAVFAAAQGRSAGIPAGISVRTDGQTITPADVELVGLSTTLATNAIVEDHGCPVCLLLIGYDADLIRKYAFEKDLVTRNIVHVRGGHTAEGDEVEPLDEAAVKQAVLAWQDQVEAFAVSGYFSVRNPAHEIRARALIEELTGEHPLPMTCGHELTSQLDSIRRATTTALNARLIPLLRDLIATVRRTLDAMQIAAPLMIVKGDGSLVRAAWAQRRPVETILSGPAASVVGAWHLAGRRDVWVVDVGGTTTDMAMLQGGLPALNPTGARVGRWRTMVEAVDIHTIGLGGDSRVHADRSRTATPAPFRIGPRRVIPLCLLAGQYPAITSELRRQCSAGAHDPLAGQFVLLQRQRHQALDADHSALLQRLGDGPQAVLALAPKRRDRHAVINRLEDLAVRGVIAYAGFTPTDALHVLGDFDRWDREAAALGAQLLGAGLNLPPETLCRRIIADMSGRIAAELVYNTLEAEAPSSAGNTESVTDPLLARALIDAPDSDIACRITLKRPVIAIGAPVEAYLPDAAARLHAELVIPPHADVANAVGAIAGGVVVRRRVLIQALEDVDQSIFRVSLPDGIKDFDDLDEAVAYARTVMARHLETLAREAGSGHVDVAVVRTDHSVPLGQEGSDALYLSTELHCTATGRPGLLHERSA